MALKRQLNSNEQSLSDNAPDGPPSTILQENGELICRLENGLVFCEWKGGKIATVGGDMLRDAPNNPRIRILASHVYEYGGIRFRVIGPKITQFAYYDEFYIMREGLQARAAQVYRAGAEKLIRFAARAEVWIYRRLPKEGEPLPVATRLSKILR